MYKLKFTENGFNGFINGLSKICYKPFMLPFKPENFKQTFYLGNLKFYFIGYNELTQEYDFILYVLR